jgi:hypothetical protein
VTSLPRELPRILDHTSIFLTSPPSGGVHKENRGVLFDSYPTPAVGKRPSLIVVGPGCAIARSAGGGWRSMAVDGVGGRWVTMAGGGWRWMSVNGGEWR